MTHGSPCPASLELVQPLPERLRSSRHYSSLPTAILQGRRYTKAARIAAELPKVKENDFNRLYSSRLRIRALALGCW